MRSPREWDWIPIGTVSLMIVVFALFVWIVISATLGVVLLLVGIVLLVTSAWIEGIKFRDRSGPPPPNKATGSTTVGSTGIQDRDDRSDPLDDVI